MGDVRKVALPTLSEDLTLKFFESDPYDGVELVVAEEVVGKLFVYSFDELVETVLTDAKFAAALGEAVAAADVDALTDLQNEFNE